MFEFHGWVTIREGTSEAEDDDALFQENIRSIKELVEVYQDGISRLDLIVSNGAYNLIMHGLRNHSQQWVTELFEKTGNIARGSYGVLYLNDDEDLEFSNEFQVLIMTRGTVQRHKDTLLSPCIPVLEE